MAKLRDLSFIKAVVLSLLCFALSLFISFCATHGEFDIVSGIVGVFFSLASSVIVNEEIRNLRPFEMFRSSLPILWISSFMALDAGSDNFLKVSIVAFIFSLEIHYINTSFPSSLIFKLILLIFSVSLFYPDLLLILLFLMVLFIVLLRVIVIREILAFFLSLIALSIIFLWWMWFLDYDYHGFVTSAFSVVDNISLNTHPVAILFGSFLGFNAILSLFVVQNEHISIFLKKFISGICLFLLCFTAYNFLFQGKSALFSAGSVPLAFPGYYIFFSVRSKIISNLMIIIYLLLCVAVLVLNYISFLPPPIFDLLNSVFGTIFFESL